jgi:hypothetical protein
MSRAPAGVGRQELTVVARRVLLDALTALADHSRDVVLVGAQAVHLHTQAAELGVAAYTSDGDLAVSPAIGPRPLIEEAMIAADFTRSNADRKTTPGIWWKRQVINGRDVAIEVDLLVPAEFAAGSPKRWSVEIPPHVAIHVGRRARCSRVGRVFGFGVFGSLGAAARGVVVA